MKPYTFNHTRSEKDSVAPLPEGIQRNIETVQSFKYKGEHYPYGVINSAVFPSVPYFSGMPGGQNLYVSNEVNGQLLDIVLIHEIECMRLRHDIKNRCWQIEHELIGADSLVPIRIIEQRLATFSALLTAWNASPEPTPGEKDMHTEARQTKNYLLGVLHDRT